MNEILNNILTRRSIRSFSDKHISKEDLDTILKAGIYAPSGMNRQTWQFTVIRSKSNIEMLAKEIRKSLKLENSYNFYGPDTIILVSNDKDNSNGLADCACALENIFLMANSLSIGSCWINQLKTICDDKNIRDVLTKFSVPENHTVWGIASLGYAKETSINKKVSKNNSVIKFID